MSDKILLDGVLDAKKGEYSDSLDDGEIFELFVVDTLLRDYSLSYDELNDGIVDGNNDGGMDAIYLFVNKSLVTEDFDFSSFKGNIDIECQVIQAKRQDSFKEAPINALTASVPLFFDLSLSEEELTQTLNNSVIGKSRLLKECLTKFAAQFPNLSINISYCCRGSNVTPEMTAKAQNVEKLVADKLTGSQVDFHFLGAKELYEEARSQATATLSLPIEGSPLNVNNAYVALVGLKDYSHFVSKNGHLYDRLFEFNIRDYEGDVSINKEIRATLEDKDSDIDFWWLNNGVTIIAEQAQHQNNCLTMTNPLIVNGLQTSNEIFNTEPEDNNKKVLVRVVDTEDEHIRDKIIKATNSQTKIKPSSLRATEEVQRRIEDYLLSKSIYYDRRKNYYKNKGMPAKQIIGIDRLAQCVYSVLIRRPDVARGRPGNIIKDDELYAKIFSLGHNLGIYDSCFRLHFVVAEYFHTVRSEVDSIYRNNLKFHTMMVLSWELHGAKDISPQELADLDISSASQEMISTVFQWLCSLFDDSGADDKVAKDHSFVEKISAQWETLFGS